MTTEPKPSTPLWPKLIILAFLLAAVLWSFWMVKFVKQTKADRPGDFFVPINTNPEPIYPTGMNNARTNVPATNGVGK